MAFSALIAALTVILLYFASIWPTGKIGLVAAASLFTAAAVVEAGLLSGLYVYIVSAALGMLIIPDRSAAILYVLFFGYYPIIKSLIERIGLIFLQWILKLAVFNTALTVIWFLLRELVLDFWESTPDVIIVYLGGSAVFALFDYGFTKVIWLYINRVSRHSLK